MVHPLIRRCGFGLALLLAGTAWAQPAAPRISAADPADARAPVPPLVWRSSFNAPDAIGLPPARDWKAANDEVQRIGGWRAYARQAAEPDLPAAPAAAPATGASGATGSAKPAPPTTPPTGAHQGHGAQHKP